MEKRAGDSKQFSTCCKAGIAKAWWCLNNMFFPRMSKDLTKTRIKSVILWLSKILNTHVLGLCFWCLSSWQEESTLWDGLNHIVDAVAGGRRECAQGNVTLWGRAGALGEISSSTEHSGVNWHAGLASRNSFEMYPPSTHLKGPKMSLFKASLKALISDSVKCC